MVDVERGAVVAPGALQETLRGGMKVGGGGSFKEYLQSIFCKVVKP